MNIARLLLITLISLFPSILSAQVEGWMYRYDNSIKVYGTGSVQKTLAWCGGFDDAQFAVADLNRDGKPDLVIYDRSIGVRTFISSGGTNYTYAPEYEANFPPVVNYIVMVDYNRDGVPDLIQQGLTGTAGFTLYKGYYNNSNQLCFKFYEQLFHDNSSAGLVNAYVNPSDIPAVVDVDNDGDYDFLSYEPLGTSIYYYQNLQVEKGLPKDTVRIRLADYCWGKFRQSFLLPYTLNRPCDNSDLGPKITKKTHAGNAICLVDMDGDGDKDYLGGNISFPEVIYCRNGRIPYGGADSIISQDTAWQNASMPIWPAIFNVDIDGDGKADIILSPNSNSSNYKCIAYYKNTGTASAPAFTYQGDTFLIDRTIDMGSYAYPMFFDYNKDGKPDLFVGSYGFYQPGGTYLSRVAYYLNTSTAGSPSFTLQTNNFLKLDTANFWGASLAVGDLDNDGKTDLVIGHVDGSFSFYKNMAASDAVQPVWQMSQRALTDTSGHPVNVGGYAAPFIYDLDKDGKPDLISGERGGYLQYYRNVSPSPGTLKLERINDKIGGVTADGGGGASYSYPFIGKMDTTGKDYILVGSNSGLLYRYTGFQNGDTSGNFPLLDGAYSYIDTSYLYILHPADDTGTYAGLRSAPAIADIDGDGLYEMVIGDAMGGLKMYKQDTSLHLGVPNLTTQISLRLYPNPATDELNIDWDQPLPEQGEIDLLNMTGQKLLSLSVQPEQYGTSLSVAGIPAGIYVCILHTGRMKAYAKIVVLK
jgi:hypothetical protein